MLFYIIYIFIISTLIYTININIILNIITTIFYYSDNALFLIGIYLGIIFKLIKNNRIKFKKYNYKLQIFIVFDIFKIFYIKYNLLMILISLLISLFIINSNKINKFIIILLYIIFPINGFVINKILYNKTNYSLMIVPSFIYIIIRYYDLFIKSSYKNIVGFIILLLSSYILYKDNKKRNIIIIFLLFIYLFYYFILP